MRRARSVTVSSEISTRVKSIAKEICHEMVAVCRRSVAGIAVYAVPQPRDLSFVSPRSYRTHDSAFALLFFFWLSGSIASGGAAARFVLTRSSAALRRAMQRELPFLA